MWEDVKLCCRACQIPVMYTTRISLLVGQLKEYLDHIVSYGKCTTIGVVHSVDMKFGDLTTNFSLADWQRNIKDTSTIPS